MRTLSRIPKLHGPIVPSPNWEMAGTTPSGQQLYIERTNRSRAVPDYEQVACTDCPGSACDKCSGTGTVDGARKYAKNPMTAEPLYPKNKPEFYVQERLFFIQSDGQGQQYKVDWTPPTPEQIAAIRHEKEVAAMVPELASALIDAGLDTAEIVRRLTVEPAAVEPPPTYAPTEEPPYEALQLDADEEL